MQLPALHIPTLCVVSALVIAFSGVVLLLARGRDKGTVPLVFWGCALLAGAAGIVLLSLEPFTRLPVLAAANMVILVGAALSWTGARIFQERPARPWLVVGGAAAWLLAHLVFTGSAERIPRAFTYLVGATYILATAAELWRGKAERLPTRPAALTLLVVHGVIYLAQAMLTAFRPPAPISNGLFLFLLVEALLHAIGMAFLFLALMRERAELQSTQRLLALATTDGLTGLGNRRRFDHMLAQEFSRADRTGAPLSLLMIDVDHFKSFNDGYGHRAGDRCLQAVASVVGGAVSRPADLALRYGGEEFAVLLPGTDEAGAACVADAIRTEVQLLAIEHGASPHRRVTVSVGTACMDAVKGWTDPDQLVIAADQALYRAKAAGRNVTMRSAGMSTPAGLSEVERMSGAHAPATDPTVMPSPGA